MTCRCGVVLLDGEVKLSAEMKIEPPRCYSCICAYELRKNTEDNKRRSAGNGSQVSLDQD